MRSSFRSFLVLAIAFLVGTTLAKADTVSLSISELASGTLGSQTFTNQIVTYTGSFTSQQFLACVADLSCYDPTLDTYSLFTYQGLVTTIAVGGIGTFDANSGNNYIDFNYIDSLASITPYNGGDAIGRLYFPTQPADVEDCEGDFPSFYCPLSASTTAGNLILTAVSDTYTTSTVVTPTSPIPEPSTMTLLATGVLGGFELVRRRLRSA
jgi:PEP-CTERM motif